MEETLVSYELAKLLNDLDIEYSDKYSSGFYYRQSGGEATDGYFMESAYKAPCLYFVQKWLREKYAIHIITEPHGLISYQVTVFKMGDKANQLSSPTLDEIDFKIKYSTYEEALEKGIELALLLIN